MYKILTYTITNITQHNSLVLKSKVSYLSIRSVYTIDNTNQRIDIIDKPIEFTNINSSIGVTYKDITSSKLYIDVDVIDGILVADILDVKVSNNRYKTFGEFRSNLYKVDAGTFIQPVVKIENQSDTYVDCLLSFKGFDRFNNILLEHDLPVIVNDDGNLIYISTTQDTKFTLPVEVNSVDDLDIYVQDTLQIPKSSYTISGKVVTFDSRNIDKFVVIYRPKFYKDFGFTKIGPNLSINNDSVIKQDLRDIQTIEYRYSIRMINLNFRTVDETPVIKTLGLITY